VHTSHLLGRGRAPAVLVASAALVAGVTAPAGADDPASPGHTADAAAITPRTSFTMEVDGSSGLTAKGRAIPNLDIVKATLRTYYNATNGIADKTSSPYVSEVKALLDAQAAYLDSAYAAVTAAGRVPAIVFDTDDTTLLTYDLNAGAMGFGSDPALRDAWVQEQRFPATPGMVSFVNAAAAKGFAVFGITGRKDDKRAATLGNLGKVGYTAFTPSAYFTRWTGEPGSPKPSYITCATTSCTTVEYKAGTRRHIETDLADPSGKRYDIVLNVGDQWSDLRGGYADRVLKLPNPMYHIPSPNLPGVREPALAPKTQFTMQPDGSSGQTVGGESIPNVDSVMATIRAYYGAGDGTAARRGSAFVNELKAKTRRVAAKIKTQCTKVRNKPGRNPAVVFDVDDTLLWSYDLLDKGSDFAGDAALRETWVQKKKYPAVPAMAKMVRKARKGGCVVIAISERDVDEATATRKNLNRRYNHAFSKKNLFIASDKAAAREQIEKQRRLRILWNVGDQPADLLGGHAEHRFQVPNPTYYLP
jgi:predicted secreted acid phosphatase